MAKTYKLRTIVHGSKGGHVGTIQAYLKGLGYTGLEGKSLAVDNDAGDNTMYAIGNYIDDKKEEGIDLGSRDGWGPLCYASMGWEEA